MDAIVVQLQQEEKLLNKSMEELRRNKAISSLF